MCPVRPVDPGFPLSDVSTKLLSLGLRAVPRSAVSQVMGKIAAWQAPQPMVHRAIEAFRGIYGVQLDEAVVPAGGFASFDAFFTRALKPGARPIQRGGQAVSPADGTLEALGRVREDTSFLVKGKEYTLHEMLQDPLLVERFSGGTYALIYLAPSNYHRVHAPVRGAVERIIHIPGTLFPVNRIGEHIPKLFVRNERVVILQRTGAHDSTGNADSTDNPEPQGKRPARVASGGRVTATVMVGAMGVGRISLAFDDLQTNMPGRRQHERVYDDLPEMAAGDELGRFHLGSTVLVFFEQDDPATQAFRPGDPLRAGTPVQMGRPLFPTSAAQAPASPEGKP